MLLFTSSALHSAARRLAGSANVLTWIIACLFLFSQNYKNKQLMSIPTWETVCLMISANLVFNLIVFDSQSESQEYLVAKIFQQ